MSCPCGRPAPDGMTCNAHGARALPIARPVQYTVKVDAALDVACRDFSKRDFFELAFAALDQAGLSAETQAELRERLDNFDDSEGPR